MSHPQPPQRRPTDNESIRYARTLHNTALVAVIACPLLALLPPRKFDVYTFGLAGTTVFSANWLVREQTGRSVWQHLGIGGSPNPFNASTESTTVPPTEQANLQRELTNARQEMQRVDMPEKPSITEQIQSQREAWKMQQQKEIQEDIEEGKGLGEMITDRIYEVWNWRKRRDDDD